MYTFKMLKNGKEQQGIKSTDDKNIAYERWDKLQGYCEERSTTFGYSYSIFMLFNNEIIHSVDYEF